MRLQRIRFRAGLRETTIISLLIATIASSHAFAQSKQYQRKKPAATPAPVAAPAGAKNASAPDAKSGAPGASADQKSDKLDISDLEQKYWAPKDTDFSVVQNRTYTKAKRFAVSGLIGPVMNDPYNAGFNYTLSANYYFDERQGVEFQYSTSDLHNSKAQKDFLRLSGGQAPPDFNRPVNFYGVGYNWIPLYAKMSVLGSKIIYFDMQFTPIVGMSTYEQQSDVRKPQKSTFTYGIDITQYYFVHKNYSLRFNYQNRWSKQDILAYHGGAYKRADNDNTSLFLLGVTYFF